MDHRVDQLVILSKLEQEYLLRAIEAALQVRDAREFFLWTQGQLQALLPHQIMVCMQFDQHGALLRLECLHGSVLGEQALRQLCDVHDGLAVRIARHCNARQLFPCIGLAGAAVPNNPLAPFQRELDECGQANLIVHGSGRVVGGSTVFALFGLPLRPGARQAYFLALVLPQLHMALLRAGHQGQRAMPGGSRSLSAREIEILVWLREGKSNADIGLLLGISGATVKNHLQRIYRLLTVANRTQAVSRCAALHLLPHGSP